MEGYHILSANEYFLIYSSFHSYNKNAESQVCVQYGLVFVIQAWLMALSFLDFKDLTQKQKKTETVEVTQWPQLIPWPRCLLSWHLVWIFQGDIIYSDSR